MANNQWDREVINVRERPLSSDINTAQSQMDRSLREVVMALFRARAGTTDDRTFIPVPGFIGDGLKARPATIPGLSVLMTAGLGFNDLPGSPETMAAVSGIGGLDDLCRYKPLPLLADVTISGIPVGPGAGLSRIDIIEVRMNRVVGNPLSRDTLDTISGLFVSGNVNKTMSYTLDGSTGVVTSPSLSTAAIGYKVGIAAGSPVAPAVTPGYLKVATVKVPTGMASVTRGNLIDERLILHPYGMMPFSAAATIVSGAAVAPVLSTFAAPPGVECVITKASAPGYTGNNRFEVWIIGGQHGAFVRGNMDGTILRGYSATEFYTIQYSGTTFGTLSAGQVALLGDATRAGPALAFAEGTPYMNTSFSALKQVGGTTDGGLTAIPDPLLLDIQGFLHRY